MDNRHARFLDVYRNSQNIGNCMGCFKTSRNTSCGIRFSFGNSLGKTAACGVSARSTIDIRQCAENLVGFGIDEDMELFGSTPQNNAKKEPHGTKYQNGKNADHVLPSSMRR
jgi:hypothetical protein